MAGITVMLDPGHHGSGYNRSPVLKSYYESNFTWDFHILLKDALEKYNGVAVLTTRAGKDDDPEVYKRGRMAEGCDLFVSIHSDASDNKRSDHVTVFHQIGESRYALEGKAFAEHVAPALNAAMDCSQEARIKTREGKRGDYYGVLRGAASVGVPAVIIEHSYHTNSRAAAWLSERKNLEKLAEIAAKEISGFFGLSLNVYCGKLPEIPKGTSLKKGDKGEKVALLQAFLNRYGGYGLVLDGSFGAKTEKALMDFQASEGLSADGRFGQRSLAAAERALSRME
ncbi:MAG: N-acetylmuramoyl-L-alanine amidase [Clostridia bacterium]|nr:N-acetylmuramoyl-L-alanine amidase [Clostridia bacterium]